MTNRPGAKARDVATDLDSFTRRTLRTLHELPAAQRAAIVEQILRDGAELAPVLPQLLALVAQVRYQRRLGPLIRDAIGYSDGSAVSACGS